MQVGQARYIAILAGNGAALLLLTQEILQDSALMAGRNALWPIAALSLFGVTNGYICLFRLSRPSAIIHEACGATAFMAVAIWWVLFLAGR